LKKGDLMAKTLIEQIRPDLFRAEIPLPRNPLKATNSYIIKGDKRNLVIDTGLNREECKTALLGAFKELGIELYKTDFFITHLHADHIGLADVLATEDATIYFNQPDAEILNLENLWQLVYSLVGQHGFPEDKAKLAIDSHPGQSYRPTEPIDFTMVNEGDVIYYSDYELHCLVTPGHSKGHTCLYEPHQKYLFSGDHILGDITPNISARLDNSDSLGEYLKSLDRIYSMPVDLVLPGHRRLIRNCRSRIEELKEHHCQRLEEVISILKEKSQVSAFDVASKMTWDLVADKWSDFPLMQQWFATVEALAHICHLETMGKVNRAVIGNTIVFSVV